MNSIDYAARRAGAQYGAISSAQARQAGLTQDQIESLVGRRLWRRPVRSVFVVAGAPDTWKQRVMIALLASGDAVASHLTAAAVHGLWRPPPLPHILVPAKHSARVPIAKVHRGNIGAGDRVTVDGIACTSPTRTLVDVAALLAREHLEAMVDDAFCGELSCVDAVRRVLDRLRRPGRWGGPLLHEVIGAWTPGIEPGSPAEMRLLRKLIEWGYEPPQHQIEIRLPDGTLIGRIDLGWLRPRVGLEYDSDRFHNPRRWEDEEIRHARFRAAGWDVLTVAKQDLLPSSDLRERVGRALLAAAA